MYSPQANYVVSSAQDGQHNAVHENHLNPLQCQESTQVYQTTAENNQEFDQYQISKQHEGSQQYHQSQQNVHQLQANAEPYGEAQQYHSSQHEYQGSQKQYLQSHQGSLDQYQQFNQGLLDLYQQFNKGSLDQFQQLNHGSLDHYQQSNQGPLDQHRQSNQGSQNELSCRQYQEGTPKSQENQCTRDANSSKCAFVVLLHGLPYSTTHEEIITFLSGCSVAGGKEGIHFVYGSDGRLNGDAFVELSSEADVTEAVKKNRNHIGKRYIEVIQADRLKMEFALRQSSSPSDSNPGKVNDCIVRLRGLPYECCKEEIANFFLGLAIVPNGITLMTDHLGRTEREGFVQFTSPDLIPKALEKHREKIQHRYIEVYKSSLGELQKKVGKLSPWTGGRPGPYDRPEAFNNYFGFGSADFIGNIKGLFEGRLCSGFGSGRMGDFSREEVMEGYRRGGRCNGGIEHYSQTEIGGEGRIMDGEQFQSQTGHFVLMRGLPYSATKEDIIKFFEPLSPVNILLEYNRNGRATGNGYVDFATYEDAKQAMIKHRATMQHRYIELYFNDSGKRFGRY